jgi:hypothetical protein
MHLNALSPSTDVMSVLERAQKSTRRGLGDSRPTRLARFLIWCTDSGLLAAGRHQQSARGALIWSSAVIYRAGHVSTADTRR